MENSFCLSESLRPLLEVTVALGIIAFRSCTLVGEYRRGPFVGGPQFNYGGNFPHPRYGGGRGDWKKGSGFIGFRFKPGLESIWMGADEGKEHRDMLSDELFFCHA